VRRTTNELNEAAANRTIAESLLRLLLLLLLAVAVGHILVAARTATRVTAKNRVGVTNVGHAHEPCPNSQTAPHDRDRQAPVPTAAVGWSARRTALGARANGRRSAPRLIGTYRRRRGSAGDVNSPFPLERRGARH
jgi:hypothetical protein